MGFRNPDHDHVQNKPNKLESNLESIRKQTAKRKNTNDILSNASDEDFERARAIVEGRMKK